MKNGPHPCGLKGTTWEKMLGFTGHVLNQVMILVKHKMPTVHLKDSQAEPVPDAPSQS